MTDHAATPEPQESDWITALRAECQRTSQGKAGARLGVSGSTVNQVLKRYLIRVVKDQAEQLYHSLNEVDSREMAIARTKLEEAVMWASKGIKG